MSELKDLRIEKKMTQQEVADLVGISIRSYKSYENDEETSLFDTYDSHQIEDPLDTITKQEYYKSVESAIDKSLSNFEKQVLNRYMQGESYVQIAQKLDTPVKSVDNAIQRIRKKATTNLNINEL